MEQLREKRIGILVAMAVFILCIFVWGTMNWRRTIPTSQRAADEKTETKVEQPQQTASGKVVDIARLTDQLLQDVNYDTDLEILDDSVASGMVTLQKKSKIKLYMGEGTCSDELLVVTATSENMATKDQTAIEQHLMEMKKSFEGYIPEQAAKIENAVIIRCGCYVVACVTADAEKAKEIIVKAFQ